MSDTKIQLKLGAIEFSGEGDKEWLATQLDRLLERAPGLLAASAKVPQAGGGGGIAVADHAPIALDASVGSKTLATFLQEKNATTIQVRKFLATAVWLESKGQARITTHAITEALASSRQTRLGNPAECLNQNVAKGHCEKDGNSFFVTAEGKKSLG